MKLHRNCFRPGLECLENRDNPSNLTVTFANHTLTISGDTQGNLVFEGNATNSTQFTLSSAFDTFNGNASPYSSPAGVQNITLSLLNNQDNVDFDNSVTPINLSGNLTINGGEGYNVVYATDLTVGKNFSILNGTNTSGTPDINTLINLNVGGNLTINNGNGGSDTEIFRNDAGNSTISGNLTITNGSGVNENVIQDTNIEGNLNITNGKAASNGIAGYTSISNLDNTVYPSIIKGNVTVTYLTGNGSQENGMFDTIVGGNMTWNLGSGDFLTGFDGDLIPQPVIVDGNFTMTGTGASLLACGTQYQETGLSIAKDFSITSGSSNILDIDHLQVDGSSKLSLGANSSTVYVDQSRFDGTFTMTFMNGQNNTFNLDMASGDTVATEFEEAVSITFGGSSSSNELEVNANGANPDVIAWSTFVVSGGFSYNVPTDAVTFPFGGSVDLK